MTVEWSTRARSDLRAILAGSQRASTQELVDRILRRGDELADQPLLGAEVPDYGDPSIREVYEQPFRVLYRVTDDGVRVITVWHAARRLPRTPPG